MVNTTIDQNPLDPNYEKRRSSLGNMDQGQEDRSKNENIMVDREVAPSSRAMCAELAHQHATNDLHQHTERRSSQEIDHNSFLSDLSTDRGLQEHPEQVGE
ncbi:hypothetical protein N7491_000092 [Penicillium cf. griseofulvum]|uniref:Uncharacterized protein n=1 Tax=Penicillium cf. griseofulvum TaxID=2972120 RepID=A0A9W9JN03_9EURO|nr:hypothetical protein N7472_004556 [Penicillium cf. griseofulvum]KAJ5442118.1 hypothetical protein N7445_005125 [Penicillium cf. griseofulvum]KAJ5450910.1 hypothetical protein N7491_000092 [Penicillium cf. griseofulvum]